MKILDRLFLAGSLIGAVCVGCAGPSKVEAVSKTPSQVAKEGLACLEKDDSACIGNLIWDNEARKTGLDSNAAKAVIEGPYAKATRSFTPLGEPIINQLDLNIVEIERSYRSSDGTRHGLALIATGGASGARLAPLSMQLFKVIGNADQKPGEFYVTAWRRVLKNNRGFFDSVGWHGMFCSSSFTDYRDWDALDHYFAGLEKKHLMAKGRA